MPAMKYAGILAMLETQQGRLGIFLRRRRKLHTNNTLKEYGNIYFYGNNQAITSIYVRWIMTVYMRSQL